jgi:hypothetical protein
MSVAIYYAIPGFFLTMFLEWLWSRRERKLWNGATAAGYAGRDTAASWRWGWGTSASPAWSKLGTVGIWTGLHAFAPVKLPNAWWVWVLLFFADDLCYYAFHRASHEVRLFWAAHVNHHSSQHYNLSTALRQSWTTPLTGIPFWLPLPLLGFEPWMILTSRRCRCSTSTGCTPRASVASGGSRPLQPPPRITGCTTARTSSTSTGTTPASSSSGTGSSAPSSPSERRCATA